MIVDGAATTHKEPSFDDLLRALDSVQADNLDEVLTALRQRGIRVPKALIDAIQIYNFDGTNEELYEFMQAMRDVFEPVWRSRRFLPPFSIAFEDVSSQMQQIFINMLLQSGITNPGD